MATQARQFV